MPRRDLTIAVVLSALAIVIALWSVGWSAALPAFVWFAVITGPLSVIDLRQHRLPNAYTLTAIPAVAVLLALAAFIEQDASTFTRAIVAGIGLLLVFLVLHIVNPSGMGLGDVKLAASMGLVLGWRSWDAVLWGTALGFFAAAVVAIALLVTKRATMKSAVPFGPFMLLGTWLAIAAGAIDLP